MFNHKKIREQDREITRLKNKVLAKSKDIALLTNTLKETTTELVRMTNLKK